MSEKTKEQSKEELQEQVEHLSKELNRLTFEVKRGNSVIGSLQQKLGRIEGENSILTVDYQIVSQQLRAIQEKE
jgi:ribosomal protein L29